MKEREKQRQIESVCVCSIENVCVFIFQVCEEK